MLELGLYFVLEEKKIKLISNRVDSAGLIYARHIAFKLEERTASSIIMKLNTLLLWIKI